MRQFMQKSLLDFAVNSLIATPLLPRRIRRHCLNACGMTIESNIVMARSHITGTRLSVGNDTLINSRVFLDAEGGIDIGAHCLIAMGASIVTSTHQFGLNGDVDRNVTHRAVRVGDDCWIGAFATILPGVNIVSGAIIAAGAVVTKDCTVPGVYAGVPARLSRSLQTEVVSTTDNEVSESLPYRPNRI